MVFVSFEQAYYQKPELIPVIHFWTDYLTESGFPFTLSVPQNYIRVWGLSVFEKRGWDRPVRNVIEETDSRKEKCVSHI